MAHHLSGAPLVSFPSIALFLVVRCPKQDFPYINLYLQTIPELLVTSGISSGTPNNIRVTAYTYPYNPSVTEP